MERTTELLDAAITLVRERLESAVARMGKARSAAGFCECEREVLSLAHEMAASLTEHVLQEVSLDPDRRAEALEEVRARAARRGIEMVSGGSRPAKVRTLGGQVVEVMTPYASAKPRGGKKLARRGATGTGVFPVLDQLGISGRSTPALRLLVARSVCEANSVSSARDLLLAGGVNLGHKTALRLSYMVCDDALRARKAAVRSQTCGNDDGAFVGRRVVASVDGGRINIRQRTAGRPKKGGRKHFVTEWREPKVLTLYVLGPDGKRDRTINSVIDGTLGDADAVFELLRYHLLRLGAHRAEDVTLVADGAVWIWNRADELRGALGLAPEKFTEIVDYFHAVERLGDVAKATHTDDAARLSWLSTQKTRLKAGAVEQIESALEELGLTESEREYWSRNRARLRFAAFRAAGLPNGSGAVESAVRRVINLRLKGASISWTEEHAEGIVHLRAQAKSGRWGELEDAVLTTTGWRPTARSPRSAA